MRAPPNYAIVLMIKIVFLFLTSLICLPAAEAKCGSINMDTDYSVQEKEDGLLVRNTLIVGKIADQIELALHSKKISTVTFECIPGGVSREADRLMHAFGGLTVRIKGYCNSACAQLAFAAKELILMDSETEHPTSLVIHAATPLNDKPTPSDYKLRNLNFFTIRFAGAIQRETIFSVLDSDPKLGLALVVVRNPGKYFPSKTDFAYECKPFPINCSPIQGSTLNELKVAIE
jgi:hypothetical protein